MTAQFKNETFDTLEGFQKWLNELTAFKVTLVDFGHDLQEISIHESGEILHCDFHASIYCGRFVKLPVIIGEPLEISDGDTDSNYKVYNGLVPEKIKAKV